MSSQYTPVKPHAGSIQNFNVVTTSSGDSRTTYAGDLLGHIEYRSPEPINAYQEWSIAGIDTVVNTIATTIRSPQGHDLAQFQQHVRDGVNEAELYQPLENIFRAIEGAAANITGYRRTQFRQLVSMTEHVPDAENMSFPDNKPDFVLAEVPPTPEALTPAVDVGTIKWRQICGFIEVKPKRDEGPNPRSPKSVKTIVSQGANYARLILAARPFQLYVLCIFIYGSKFCLGWYDRRGVILSDDYDISDNLDILIKVILQLTTHMTSFQLGHDKTARLVEGHSYYQDQYPSFQVGMGGDGNTRQWKTYGPPIWSSLSLLGRGTATWRAVSLQDKQNIILKTLWRSRTRQSESDVYGRIKPGTPGVAELSVGDDVRFAVGRETNVPVTVGWLRSSILNNENGVRDDPVLHRLALSTVGRPLWDAETSKEFILGSLAALKGHEALVEQEILHRDMSPGNLYVGEPGCAEGWEGFIADLELASVTQPITTDEPINRPREKDQRNKRVDFQEKTVSASSKGPGAEITGTALFMAGELLDKMLYPDEKSIKKIRPAEIKRGVHHDLESFVLVLFYSAMKRGLERGLWHPPAVQRIRVLYQKLFGGHTIMEIVEARKSFLGESPVYLFDNVDPPMEQLLYGLWRLLKLQRANNPKSTHRAKVDKKLQWSSEEAMLITYEKFYDIYEVAISELSAAH